MPQMIEVPGQGIVEFPDGMTDDQISKVIKSNMLSPKKPIPVPAFEKEAAQITSSNTIKDLLGKSGPVVAADALGSVASGGVNSILGGLSGLGVGITNALGLTNTTPADAVRNFQEGAYQPQTESGRKVASAMSFIPEKIAQLGDYLGGKTTDATGSPLLGTLSNVSTQAIPAMFGATVSNALRARGARIDQANAAREAANVVRDDTHRAALNEGYAFPPSQTNPTFFNNRLESIAGKDALKQEAIRRNQEVTTRIAKNDLPDFPQDQPLTPGNLERYRNAQSAPYREIANIDPVAAQALQALRDARSEASIQHRYYRQSGVPDALRNAQAADANAAALENWLESVARSHGTPDLVGRMRAARQNIAKSYDVEGALNVGDANVSAPAIGSALDRGAPMSGGLLTIGRTQQAQAFRPFMRTGAPTPGVSALEPLLMGEGAAGVATGHPVAGSVAMGLPLIRGPVRSYLLSPEYQRSMLPTYQRGMLSQILPDSIDAIVATEAAKQADRKGR